MVDLLAGFCGGVLAYAALAKIGAFEAFGNSLQWITPSVGAARRLATAVIALEVILGCGVLVPAIRPEAATAGMALLTVFAVILIYARLKRLRASCMCFGGEAEPITASVIVRDGALVVLLWAVSFGAREGSLYLESAGAGGFLLLLMLASLRTSLGWIRKRTVIREQV